MMDASASERVARASARTAGSAGFTLLEVLVALAVLATALAAAIRVGSEAADNTVHLRERTYAGWVAENQLARVRSGMEPLEGVASRTGRAELGGMEWDWELEARQADPELPADLALPDLLELEVRVFRQGESERSVATRSAWYRMPAPREEDPE